MNEFLVSGSGKQVLSSRSSTWHSLKQAGLHWKFEFPAFVFDEHKRPRIFIPDFYLRELGVFIEVCGSVKFDYNRRKNIYENNGIAVVFLHYYKDPTKWSFFLEQRIKEIEQQRQTEACKLAARG